MRRKNFGFTLAEVLIVIGIIGVVAALTLPNLNHATGDKETVTRLQKAYSILNEANDRAVAIYGPISTWSEECRNELDYCWMKRIGEFLKIAKSCDQKAFDEGDESAQECNNEQWSKGEFYDAPVKYVLPDGITFSVYGYSSDCTDDGGFDYTDGCLYEMLVDVNGLNKGKNKGNEDIFRFEVLDSLGITATRDDDIEEAINDCAKYKNWCTWWVLEYGNLDFNKADNEGKCPNGTQLSVNQTSCN